MVGGFQTIIDNFIRWGDSCKELYAAFIFGSQARESRPSDEYSDVDILMFVDDPDFFLSSDQWLHDIGDYHVFFAEDSLDGGKERRVLFDGALDVDFLLLPRTKTDDLTGEVLAILQRGYRILIDKINLQSRIPPFDAMNQSYRLPTEQEFGNLANNFWYHTVWAAKKLKRGEIWTAKFCVDSYMKQLLLSLIECHAHVVHGTDYDTWHNGRFIEEWAESWVVEKLSLCFSHYDQEDIKSALLSTMAVFRSVCAEIADKTGYPYPKEADAYTTAWVTKNLV